VKLPPSLKNIFKELGEHPGLGSLVEWARSGVLLLNTCLTVEDGSRPAMRSGLGGADRSPAVAVAATASPCVYLLWGAHAQAKAGLIEADRGRARPRDPGAAGQPSVAAVGARPPVPFLGCGHFAQAREWLAAARRAGRV
jgi:uracil-DNA glycosylase